jgi:predicted alpha/beta hydrolase family esterase
LALSRSDLPVLQLPGWEGSGPDHWQTFWESKYGDSRVEQSDWERPLPIAWLTNLELAVARSAPRQLANVTHRLGAHLLTRWGATSKRTAQVAAAMLVSPPDLEHFDIPEQLEPWLPQSHGKLPFPSLVVASDNDPYTSWPHMVQLAEEWGATIKCVPGKGQLNQDIG